MNLCANQIKNVTQLIVRFFCGWVGGMLSSIRMLASGPQDRRLLCAVIKIINNTALFAVHSLI